MALQQQVADMAWTAMALFPSFLALAGDHVSTRHPMLFQSTHLAFLDHAAIHTLIGTPYNAVPGKEAQDTPWAEAAKAAISGTGREAALQRTFADGRFFRDDARACVFKTTGTGAIGQTARFTATFIPKLNAFTTETASVNVLLTRAELMQVTVVPGRLGANDMLSNYARQQLVFGTYRLPTLFLPMEFMCRCNFFELDATIWATMSGSSLWLGMMPRSLSYGSNSSDTQVPFCGNFAILHRLEFSGTRQMPNAQPGRIGS